MVGQGSDKRENERESGWGLIVGIRKELCDSCKVTEWDNGMIVKIQNKINEKEIWIIFTYNNVGFKNTEKAINE